MILLLDVGNTRVKWAWLDYLEIAPAGAIAHDATHRSWQGQIAADGHRPDRIVVSNVAGPAFAAALTLWSRDHFHREPEFILASPALCGVTNGYQRPAALGVDRWLALIAAWRSAERPTLVINAGTALTIDAIDGTGRHRGGLILPGVQMMSELWAPWANAAPLVPQASPALLPGDTVPFAQAALGERVLANFAAQLDSEPRLLVTGGDSRLLAAHLPPSAEIVPDLVLTGLAIVATRGAEMRA